ncbi:uncharacterized protein [Linepithema humile]|uniref:uncharacterized protein isoform X2 n=1 Tax=Linepithema humile TaxID=83485 RepID=UPI00351DD5CA
MKRVYHKRFENLTNRQKRNRIQVDQGDITSLSDSSLPRVELVDDISSFRSNFDDFIESVAYSESSVASSDYETIDANSTFPDLQECEISSDDSSTVNDIFGSENTFAKNLAKCFLVINLTAVQGNAILKLLRSHPCFEYLPKDMRTLVHTPKSRVQVVDVEPGQYWHVGFIHCIIQQLSHECNIPDVLRLHISTDGASADKKGIVQYWPLQIRIVNLKNSKPLIVGVYRGKKKPQDPNSFFRMLVEEMKVVINSGGIRFKDKLIPVTFECFIADAPARAFVLQHKGHMSSKPCSKCNVTGTVIEGTRHNVFLGVNHVKRTDENYNFRTDTDHHKDMKSPLEDLNIRMVTRVPFEYMHSICLGIMKKCIEAWVLGKFGCKNGKLRAADIEAIDVCLKELDNTCPGNFTRRPRALSEFQQYKATEFRHLLLYAGSVVLYGILDDNYYLHFMLLHVAMRLLTMPTRSDNDLKLAEDCLKLFVDKAVNLYGSLFMSYNTHCLLHIVDDVRELGPLDDYSAFPYENNMLFFQKYVRNQHRPLQQFALRLMERNVQHVSTKRSDSNGIIVSD